MCWENPGIALPNNDSTFARVTNSDAPMDTCGSSAARATSCSLWRSARLRIAVATWGFCRNARPTASLSVSRNGGACARAGPAKAPMPAARTSSPNSTREQPQRVRFELPSSISSISCFMPTPSATNRAPAPFIAASSVHPSPSIEVTPVRSTSNGCAHSGQLEFLAL